MEKIYIIFIFLFIIFSPMFCEAVPFNFFGFLSILNNSTYSLIVTSSSSELFLTGTSIKLESTH